MTDIPRAMTGPRFLSSGNLRQWLPVAALAAVIAVAYLMGLHKHLSLAALAENRDALRDFVASNLVLAVAVYAVLYIVIVALSLPGAAVMSIAGGFLFGWMLSVPVTVTAATIGAIIVFQIVKTSLGAALADRAGPMVQRLSRGFAEDAFNYLLFLRLVPVFPFFIVNAVAGLCSVRLRTFIAATVLGIIPASIVFALLGSGLDGTIDAHLAAHQACVAQNGIEHCTFNLEPSALVTPELIAAFAGLGVIALLPIGIKYLRGRKPL